MKRLASRTDQKENGFPLIQSNAPKWTRKGRKGTSRFSLGLMTVLLASWCCYYLAFSARYAYSSTEASLDSPLPPDTIQKAPTIGPIVSRVETSVSANMNIGWSLDTDTPTPIPSIRPTPIPVTLKPTDRPTPMPTESPIANSTIFEREIQTNPNLSSIDYYGCCGAGHRMLKTAEASFMGYHTNYSVRVHWGYCDRIDVYSYLFGSDPVGPFQQISIPQYNLSKSMQLPRYGYRFPIYNAIRGFSEFRRTGKFRVCPCQVPKIQKMLELDVLFYSQQRERFRGKEKVNEFVKERLSSASTSIGLHIRAGNGELGHFVETGRQIVNETEWLENLLRSILAEDKWKRPRTIFVATDTAYMIPMMQKSIAGMKHHSDVTIVELPQNRPSKGEGVRFGAMGNVLTEGKECLQQWESVFADMMILSLVDVLVAPRSSSFTKSLPMSLLFARPLYQRRVQAPFCELNHAASEMRCFENITQWCCNGTTAFAAYGTERVTEIVQLPFSALKTQFEVKPRPKDCTHIRQCIPLDRSAVTEF